jgi:hypothetical protein
MYEDPGSIAKKVEKTAPNPGLGFSAREVNMLFHTTATEL